MRCLFMQVTTRSLGARVLRKCKGIHEVNLWTVPYDVYLSKQTLARNEEAAADLIREHRPYRVYPPLANGRLRHLRGKIENDEGQPETAVPEETPAPRVSSGAAG